MTLRRFVKKLPGVLQTEVQKEFYAATFDQVFNPANVESAQGFIGRRTSDVLDPTTDVYLEEPTKNRASYQLEPIAYAVNSALQDTNQLFYEDLINYLEHRGGNIDNHGRLFADEYYSFAPPIDVDKYLNYQNYLWLPGDGSDPTNTAPIAFVSAADDNLTPADMDAIIEGTYDPASVGATKGIIGSRTFNTSEAVYQEQQLLSPRNFEFTSGIRVQFIGSASYNKPFYIEGVGRAIRLVAEEDVLYPSSTVDIVEESPAEPTPLADAATNLLATPDYITIERGSVEGSAWARSNRWFHEDAVDTLTQLGQLQGGTIIQGGNGYSIGDVLLINIGDGVNGSFVVTSVALGGVINGISVFTRGEGYTFAIVDETGVPTPVSELQWDNDDPFGLGSAWDPDNVVNNPSGYLTIIGQNETDFDESLIDGSVSLGGTGYSVSDTLTIIGGTGTPATFNVDSVDALTGAVTGISIISSGTYSAIPTTPADTSVAPSGGTGCTINLDINGTFVDGTIYVADDANSGAAYPSGLTFANGSPSTIVRTDGATFTSDGMVTGQQILVSNSANPTNNGYYTIDTVTADTITLIADETFDVTGLDATATLRHLDVNTMSDGSTVRVDTVDAGGEVLTFTILTSTTTVIPASGTTLTQTSTTGSGINFALTLNSANERGVTLWDDNTITSGSGGGAYIEANLASAVSRTNKAVRPILEFKRDLDLFDYGTRYYGTVDVAAATEDFGDIESQPVGVQVDGVTLTTGMRLIFLDPDTIATFLLWDEDPSGNNTPWDSPPWEVDGVAGAITRFVWEVDATGGTISLNKYDLLNDVVGDVPVEVGGSVNVTSGNTWAGYEFYQNYNDDTEEWNWRAGQQKFGVNQPMLYSLYDTSGISLADELEYPSNDFSGSEIFSYKILTQERLNELGGGTLVDDSVLGFPVETKGFRQLGDIIFENDLETNRSNYTPVGESETEIRGYYYYRQFTVDELILASPALTTGSLRDALIGESYLTNWKTSTSPEEQRVIDRYLTETDDEDTFPVSVRPPTGEEACLVVAQGRRLNTSEFAYLISSQSVRLFARPTEYDGKVGTGAKTNFVFNIEENIEITVDSVYQELGVHYYIDDDTPGSITAIFYTAPANGAFVQATNRVSGAPGANSVVEIMTCTADALPEDSIGYFEIPNGLENNPNNLEIEEQSWNEFTPHFTSIITEQEVYEGDAFGAGNNYRDTAKDGSLGTFALQSQAPLLKAMFCISNSDLDIIDSIRFNKEEYTRFKNKYIKTAQQLLNEGFQPFSQANPIDVSEWVDEILRRITRGREFADAFSDTYMIAWNNVYQEEAFTGNDSSQQFTTSNFVDLTDKRNTMYVYIDGVIQAIDRDYDITNLNPIQITFEDDNVPALGAAIVIRLYENSAPAHIPSTPTKLGMYPAYRPSIETDNTYLTPADVIVGHDGSRTPVYGTEIDDLLLELETRIYNGLLDKFRMATVSGDTGTYAFPIERDTHKPGKFRSTSWSLREWNDLIKQSFFKWSASNRTDYITNNYYDVSNEWTYNYKTVDDVDGVTLPSGYWRGIFDHYYDTQTPESTPWEMLGFIEQPIWWEACSPRPVSEGDFLSDGVTLFTGYGPGPWPEDSEMWIDIENGHIRRVYDPIDGDEVADDATFYYWVSGGVDARFARPDLVAKYLPVDALGALKADPLAAIDVTDSLTAPTAAQAQDDYTWGDWSPIEYAWRTSESYPFALMEALFLARPGEFGEKFWDPEHIFEVPVDEAQIVNDENDLRKRIGNDLLYVHGETVGGVSQINTGYQVWITSRLRTLRKDPAADFGDLLRTLDVKLGHKMAGFTDKDTLRVFVEGISVSSAATNLLVPSENIDVALYTGTPANNYFYGGVLIKALSNDTYQIFGYDILKGEFEYYERDEKNGTSTFNVGGEPADFRVYENNTTYQAGEIVKLNGIFYRAIETHESITFDPTKWTKLNSLPVTGGLSGTWKANNTGNLLTLQYGEKLTGTQAVLDFLAGWNDYLEDQGWTFSEIGGNGQVNDWLKVSKDFLLWVGTNWEDGSLIMLSPGGEKAVLNALEGYPGNVEKISNGVYSILNKEGVAIDPANTVINREDRLIEIEPEIAQTGIFGLRVSTFETENIITFDNVTEFNDTIYDPVLGSRLARLDFRGRRTLDWTGKLEAAGFIITADGLLPNYENIVDSIRNYHNTEVQLDRPDVENTARHLIGFDERDYFTDLGILDDAQFQFYQGLVRQKGTRQAIEKLERNALVTSIDDELEVIEEWALKVGEFGGVCRNQFTEFLIAASEVKVDPQLVQLSYPSTNNIGVSKFFDGNDVDDDLETFTITNHGFSAGDTKLFTDISQSGTSTITGLTSGNGYAVIVVDSNTIQLAELATPTMPIPIDAPSIAGTDQYSLATYIDGKVVAVDIVSSSNTYTIAPNVFFTNHPDDVTGNGASATSVLDTDGTLLRIDILSQGNGYTEPPIVTIGTPTVDAGADRAIARIRFDIDIDIASDDVILIDIDDETRWITKPAGPACDVASELWPESPEETYRVPNAGYVHKDDVTFTAFDTAAVDSIINNTTLAFEHGQTIWMARNPRETFGVYFMDNYRAATVDAQDETSFDGVGDNGTFFGGSNYGVTERIIMSDGTEVIVDAISSGVVTEFTIDVPSTSSFPARGGYTLTAASSNIVGNNDFTITVGTNNETSGAALTGVQTSVTMTGDGTATLTSLPREDVIKAQFEIGVDGTPSGDVTSVTILDGGFGYKSDGTFTISRNTHGDERDLNEEDAIISYTVANGVVTAAVVDTAGSGYGRYVTTPTVNATGSGYNISDVLTVSGGSPVSGGTSATLDITEVSTVAAQTEANFDGIPANEGSFVAGTGHAATDVITMSDGSTITVDASTISTIRLQDETDFDGIGSNGTFNTLATGADGDIITLSDGTVVQVVAAGTPDTPAAITEFRIIETTTDTNVGSGVTLTQVSTSGTGSGDFSLTLGTNNEQTTAITGVVTEFTVTTSTTTGITENNTELTQTSTTGLGTGFTLTLGQANQGVYNITIADRGSYATDPSTTAAATTVAPSGGTGCTLDLVMFGDNITVDSGDVPNPIGWGRYLGNSTPGAGSIFAGGTLYDYVITSGLNVNLTKDGVAVLETDIVDNTPFFTLMDVRFADTTERTLFGFDMQFNGVSKVWTDDNGSGLWTVSDVAGYSTTTANAASAVVTVADNVSEGHVVGYEGLPDVIVPEPFEVDIDDGTTTETFRITMFNDHGQGTGFEVEITDFSAPYNSPLFEDISSIEINHVGETGFDINSASLENSFDASTLNSPFASFGAYGFKMYVIDPATNGFKQYTLSTAFDTTTATLDGTYDIDTAEAGMQFGVANQYEPTLSQRGQSFVTFGTTSNRLKRWFTPTDWDLSSATVDSPIAQSEDVSAWTETPNLNGGAFFIVTNGSSEDMYWLDGVRTQIQHWDNKLNEIQDVTEAGKAADIDLSTLSNFNWGFPRSMTLAGGGYKLIILDDNYNATGNSYLCEIPLSTKNDPSSFSVSAPEKTRLLSDIYGTETTYQPHISGYYDEKYFILCGDSTDRILTFNAAVATPSPLVLNTIDVGSGGDLDHGGSTEGVGYLYMWFPTSGGYWGNADIGLSYSITINSGDPVLAPVVLTARTEDDLIETSKFENAYVYEAETKDTLAQIPVYDPFKGILPGNAAQNIKYIRQRDPARYTNSSDPRLIDEDLVFDGDQVGDLWWDTSTSSYVYYEQGTDTYRRDNWGKLFPGSSVDVYEWTRHTGTPDTWEGDGTVRNTTDYVQIDEWDPILEEVRTFYYFWIKNRTEIPGGANRTVAAFEVANIITNPVANLYQWFSPISQSAFMFAGVDNVFTDSNNIFQINYRRDDTERPLHVEWELGRDSDSTYEINNIHWNKMVDSLCGFTDEIDITADAYTDPTATFNTDGTGIDTPTSNAITALEAHGFEPGAGVVYSKNGGVENIGLTEGTMYYVEVISDTEFAVHAESQQADPIPPTVVNPASRVPVTPSGTEQHTFRQSTTAVNNFSNALPTAADPTKGYLIVPDPSLSTTQQLGIRTRPMQSMFLDMQAARRVWRDKVNELTNDIILRDVAPTWASSLTTNNLWEWVDWYADGYDATNTVPVRQVDDTSDLAFLEDPIDGDLVKVTGTRYSVYEYDAETDIYTLIAREASRLNILADVYTSDPTLEIAIELREIINALELNVFIGDIAVYSNSVFFAMLNYVFSEQDDLDWAFKSTYIFLDQTGRTLEQDRVFQEDPFDAALEYITEAKPYHSKVRDFRITRQTALDEAPGTVIESLRNMYPFLVFDQIRGGNLSVTEMRIAKYEMAQDLSWKGYTTLNDETGTPIDVRLGAAGRAMNIYRDELADIQGPSGGIEADIEVTVIGNQVVLATLNDGGSGYTDGIGLTFNLTSTAGGGDGTASIEYDVAGGIITSVSMNILGNLYNDGTFTVDSSDLPARATGSTLREFDPVYNGFPATTEELVAVSTINAALTTEFFYDYQGSLLRNTSFGGLPTLESFALVLDEEGNTAAGTGYVVGEILSLDAGSGVPVSNALFRVATITGSGGITSLDLVSGGSYTQTPTIDPVDLNGGSGTSAQVTTLIFENGDAVPFDTTPWDQIGFESSPDDDAVTTLTGSPDGFATTIPGQTASDYDGTGENGSFVVGTAYSTGAANTGLPYTAGLTWTDNGGTGDTITRTDGTTFVTTDGMEAGMQIIVSNAAVVSNNGTYTIESVTDTVITLTAGSGSISAVGNPDTTATFTFHDVITMTDGTDVRVDAVGGGGEVSAFTIINGSSSFLPVDSTITQLSVSGGTGSDFQLTLGDANETSGSFANIPAEESFSGSGSTKEFDITTLTPTFFMFAVVDGVEQVLNVDYFFIGSKLVFVSILDTNGQRAFGAPPAGTDNIELYTYIEAGDLINPQVTEGITEEMVPLDPRENLVLIADTHNATLNAAGTGYSVGDVLTVVGGTFTTAMTLVVLAETGGIIDEVAIIDSGVYTVLPGAGAATTVAPAGGTGATIDFTQPSYSFRLHNDTLNNMIFSRNTESASTTLRSNIGTADNVIPVAQGENLYTTAPSRQDPQIAWIGTERIVYHGTTATKEATFTIDTDGAGLVSGVTLVSGGTGYTDGTGFTFTVTTATGIAGNDDAVIAYDVAGGVVISPTVSVAGTGYTLSQTGVAVAAADTNDPDVLVWELTGVIRGTSGTHAQSAITGTKVYDGGSDQDIPVTPYVYWVNTASASYASSTGNDGEWRYHGNNLAHFVLETTASTIHTTNSIVVGDTLRPTSGTFIQNSYYIKDLIDVGEVSKIDVTDAGTGYSAGDVINTSALDSALGGTGASLVIQGVDVNGGITHVGILDRGTGYTSATDLNFVVTGGNGDATITVYADREGLALAIGGDIISQFGVVVERNNTNWAVDRALPGGLVAATTAAAAFLNAEPGDALTLPAP
jgi:hypothetical protein